MLQAGKFGCLFWLALLTNALRLSQLYPESNKEGDSCRDKTY